MISPEVREAVFAAYGRKCLRCGDDFKLAVDHVVPTSRGGSDDPSNLQPLCKRCNSGKGAKTVDYRKEILPIAVMPLDKSKGTVSVDSQQMSIRLPVRLYNRIKAAADTEHRTFNNLVVKYLKERHPEYKTLPDAQVEAIAKETGTHGE